MNGVTHGTTIICPICKKSFEISDAIQHQIEDELYKAKTEQSEILRKEYDVLTEAKIKEAVQAAVAEEQQASEILLARERQSVKLALEKAKQTTELEIEKAKQTTELETERLRREAASSKENEKQLREQLKTMLDELCKANKARENAEFAIKDAVKVAVAEAQQVSELQLARERQSAKLVLE